MLKFIDFFAGIGGFRRGMEMAGHQCVGHCEWDKFAHTSYEAIHEIREDEWFGKDIREVRASELPGADVWCFGFPCQDISVAGKQLGFDGKRSSLFFTVTRLIRDTKEEDRPKYLFIENVKNLFSVNGGTDFLKLLIELDEIGYDAEWQLLNTKNFGLPQNRERVFVIGHLRGRSGRKVFPIGGISQKANINIIGTTVNPSAKGTNCRHWVHDTSGDIGALSATDYKQPKQILVRKVLTDRPSAAILTPKRTEYGKKIRKAYESGEVSESRHNMTRLEPRTDGITNTLTTVQKDNYLLIKEATKQGYAIAKEGDSINLEQSNSQTRRGRVGKGIANTLTCSCNQGTLDGYRIRRLTPKECWRLQGWLDSDFEKAASVCSDSQLYKQAGNGVSVPVIYTIAQKLI